ncbi:MAG TPA: lysophospholipid acyltransferase family protein [Beijerinckiaceae bacterium]|nr:lysophospholipid acyltransferase family protein [Beijerinckiaceae bacterium]
MQQQIQFSYANANDSPLKRLLIHAIEAAVGQPRLKQIYFDLTAQPLAQDRFFRSVVQELQLELRYDKAQLAKIPRTGPLVIVANHPFGALDGIVLCRLIEEVRPDFLALVNSVLLRVPELHQSMLPVDFSGTRAATETNLSSRQKARAHLVQGGALIVFPSGTVATSPDRLGLRPAVEVPWPPFTAQLIQRGQANVVPVFFPGQNSWLFQVVSHVSQTLRMALLFREVKNRIGTALSVEIGDPIPFSALAAIKDRQALINHLRQATYALAERGSSVDSAATAVGGNALVGEPGA